MTERIVVLLDMDCFYVQVEERHHPHIKGQPAAVVQYNTWKGGGIIAVNYEARAFGVKRGMRGDEARSKCPEIQLVQVPVNRGKADLTRYRDAGKEVINVLCDFSDSVERASIDEAYIDFTSAVQEKLEKCPKLKINMDELKSSWVVGYDQISDENTTSDDKEVIRRNGIQDWLSSFYEDEEEDMLPVTSSHPHYDDFRLAIAAILCEEMRAAVLERTGFKCSAGVAHNKMLGKLSCGLHKPNQQTILPQNQVQTLWQILPVGKVRNLGGKLGDSLKEELGCNTMGDLESLSLQQLTGRYDNKTAHWLHNLGRGIDTEAVTARQLTKSIGCGKNFQGREALNTQEKVQKWMLSLSEELSERLNVDQSSNKRHARTLTISVRLEGDDRFTSMSRSSNLPSYNAEIIARLALSLIQHTNQAPAKDHTWSPAIKNISLSAGKFDDWTGTGSGDIQELFRKVRENARNHEPSSNSELPNKTCENTNALNVSSGEPQVKAAHSECVNIPRKLEVSKGVKTSQKQSNSFFKNFILKSDNNNIQNSHTNCSNSDVTNIPSDNINTSSEQIIISGNESAERSALDMLVSCLSDDENGVSDASDNDSVYDAATDIDCSGTSEIANTMQESPDMFGDDSIDKNILAKTISRKNDKMVKSTTEEIPGHSSIVPEEGIVNRYDRKDSSRETISSTGLSKVSVEELFPDLDNFDESLLSFLPKELKLEVQNALKEHKKSKNHQKKSGLWKFMTINPFPLKEILASNNSAKATVPSDMSDDVVIIDDVVAGPSGVKEQSRIVHCVSDARCLQMTKNDIHSSSSGELQAKENAANDVYKSSNDACEDMVDCDQCGLKISAFEMPEHSDYHVALNLQSDLKKETNVLNRSLDKSTIHSGKSGKGKKRGKVNSKMPQTPEKGFKIQKLDAFFKL